MHMEKKHILGKIKELLDEFEEKHSPKIQKLSLESKKMTDACETVKESWSGSCFGFHHKLYYGNFEKPPRGEMFSVEWGTINGLSGNWQERSSEEVKKEIEKIVKNNFNVDEFQNTTESLASDIQELQSNIDAVLTSVISKGGNNPLENVEKVEPEKKRVAFVKNYMSGTKMSRDSEAVAQGIFIPSIIYYEAVAYDAECVVSQGDKYLKAVKHFLKWYELQNLSVSDSNQRPLLTDLSLLHPDIFSKCQRLFESGEYPEAVEKGFKVVRDKLRSLTSYETGSEAFGKGKLHIKGAAAANVEEDFNEGVKFLTMAIDRFRNEKSHTANAYIDEPQQAYEYLSMSSLAMNLLERAEIK